MSDEHQAGSVVAGSAEVADEPMAPLERRYRRWVGLYPVAYRHAREDELVGVLLDAASPGQDRPRPADVVDLARAAAVAQVRTVRSSPRRREWSDASTVVGVILAVVLAAQSTAFASLTIRRSLSSGEYGAPPLSYAELRGWYVPVAWMIVVALLVLGSTRLACVAAWLASGARITYLYEIATVPPFPWATGPDELSVAQPVVVQLTLGLIAAVLLSRPRRVRATIDAIGRRRLCSVIAAFVVLFAVQRARSPFGSGLDLWVVVLPFAIVLACSVDHVRLRRIHHDPVARRIGAGLLAVLVVFMVSETALGASGAGGVTTRRDLAAAFVIGLATAVTAALLLAVAPVAARRFPYRLVRRRS